MLEVPETNDRDVHRCSTKGAVACRLGSTRSEPRELFWATTGTVAAFVVLSTIIRPVFAQHHVYWGDVHGHTRLSDGKGTVDDYFKYARDVSKLDFVIATDHDFGNASPWRMPKEDWTLTQDSADRHTKNGRFVAIAGYEWTSQTKYWTDVDKGIASERLFPGPPRFYNHKNVYFPSHVDYIFSAKDPAYNNPKGLAEAVRKYGGLVHNCHPTEGLEGRDQFAYDASCYDVIANIEMGPDTLYYQGTKYDLGWETVVRAFLNRGGKTGFVGGTDTHEGRPAARTAVLAWELTRPAVFEALRHRRNYVVTNARIVLDFQVNGHFMGEEIEIEDKPEIVAEIKGTDEVEQVVIVRDGSIIYAQEPRIDRVRLEYVDKDFQGSSYYYLRVTQADKDEYGNPSQAWSSPIWVKKKR